MCQKDKVLKVLRTPKRWFIYWYRDQTFWYKQPVYGINSDFDFIFSPPYLNNSKQEIEKAIFKNIKENEAFYKQNKIRWEIKSE